MLPLRISPHVRQQILDVQDSRTAASSNILVVEAVAKVRLRDVSELGDEGGDFGAIANGIDEVGSKRSDDISRALSIGQDDWIIPAAGKGVRVTDAPSKAFDIIRMYGPSNPKGSIGDINARGIHS
jgi:hypothetical protein